MNTDVKISVIVPVYNTELYLDECINSLLEQTLKEIEILCIDDGSEDSSAYILEKYKNDPRIKVYNEPHRGVSAARNLGMKLSEGEYLYFMDSDDFLLPEALEMVYKRAKQDDLDIVFFNGKAEAGAEEYSGTVAEQNTLMRRTGRYKGVYSGFDLMNAFYSRQEYWMTVWLQLYRRDFLFEKGLFFYEGIIHEDNLFTFSTLLSAGRCGYLEDNLYIKRVRPESVTTGKPTFENIKGYFVCYLQMRSFLSDMDSGHRGGAPEVIMYKTLKEARKLYSLLDFEERHRYLELPYEEQLLFQSLVIDYHVEALSNVSDTYSNVKDGISENSFKKRSFLKSLRLIEAIKIKLKNLNGFLRRLAHRMLPSSRHNVSWSYEHLTAQLQVQLQLINYSLSAAMRNEEKLNQISEKLESARADYAENSGKLSGIIMGIERNADLNEKNHKENNEYFSNLSITLGNFRKTAEDRFSEISDQLCSDRSELLDTFTDSHSKLFEQLKGLEAMFDEARKGERDFYTGVLREHEEGIDRLSKLSRTIGGKINEVVEWLSKLQTLYDIGYRALEEALADLGEDYEKGQKVCKKSLEDLREACDRRQNACQESLGDFREAYNKGQNVTLERLTNLWEAYDRGQKVYQENLEDFKGIYAREQKDNQKSFVYFLEAYDKGQNSTLESLTNLWKVYDREQKAVQESLKNLWEAYDSGYKNQQKNISNLWKQLEYRTRGISYRLNRLRNSISWMDSERQSLLMPSREMIKEEGGVILSIIIPVYNMEKTLDRCLDSVIRQSLESLEIICINDGSTDGTVDIIKQYQMKDDRVRLIMQERSGAGNARNAGLGQARGKYVAFMDADDFYPGSYVLETLVQTAIFQDAAVCGGSIRFVRDSMEESSCLDDIDYSFWSNEWIRYEDFQQDCYYQRFIYDRNLLNKEALRFPSYKRYQDVLFFLETMIKVEKFYCIPMDVYCYHISEGIRKMTTEEGMDILEAVAEELAIAKQRNYKVLHERIITRLPRYLGWIEDNYGKEIPEKITAQLKKLIMALDSEWITAYERSEAVSMIQAYLNSAEPKRSYD